MRLAVRRLRENMRRSSSARSPPGREQIFEEEEFILRPKVDYALTMLPEMMLKPLFNNHQVGGRDHNSSLTSSRWVTNNIMDSLRLATQNDARAYGGIIR
eukprot:762808-Hanusia_phi.AAC.4